MYIKSGTHIHVHENNKHLNNFIYTCIGTGIAEYITSPFCLLKTKANMIENKKISNIDIAKQIYKEEGIISFWKSANIGSSQQMLTSGLKYTLYMQLIENDFNSVLSGCLAGIMTCSLVYPIDYFKTRQQKERVSYSSILSQIKINPKIMYQGYSMSFLKSAWSGMFYFPLRQYIINKTDSNLAGSIISALISTTLTQPFDYLKTNMINNNFNLGKFLMSDKFRIRHLFSGLSFNLCRVVPHFTITMFVIDTIKENSLLD